MRLWTFVLLGSMAWLSGAAAEDAPKPLTPEEAVKKVDEVVTVQMEVKSASVKNGVSFLNSEADFKSAKNLTLFVDKAAMVKFKDAKINDPAEHFKGKTVTVKGKVVLFKERAEIKVDGPDAIKVVEKK